MFFGQTAKFKFTGAEHYNAIGRPLHYANICLPISLSHPHSVELWTSPFLPFLWTFVTEVNTVLLKSLSLPRRLSMAFPVIRVVSDIGQ